MAARSAWKGFLKLSLVSIPVKAYTATSSSGGDIRLNQLHKDCHSRIKYQKTCPIHGEVTQDQIVSGYEYSKGQYVVVDPDELDKLRTEDDKAVKIDTFITTEDLDPVYLSGRTYYLVPDGPIALRPYAVMLDGMKQQKRHGIARVVMHGREQLMLIRPIDNLIGMSVLNYDAEITKPSTFEEEVPKQEITAEESKLVKTLIDATTQKKFDFSAYKDTYTEKLTTLIEAKVQGKEIVAPPMHEQVPIINLMDALKQSVAQMQTGEGKPPKKMAPSKRKEAGETRKRKSG